MCLVLLCSLVHQHSLFLRVSRCHAQLQEDYSSTVPFEHERSAVTHHWPDASDIVVAWRFGHRGCCVGFYLTMRCVIKYRSNYDVVVSSACAAPH